MMDEVDVDALMDEIVKDDPAPVEETSVEPEVEPETTDDVEEEVHDDGEEPSPAPDAPVERSGEAASALKAAKVAGLPESMLSSVDDSELIGWHQSKLKNDADIARTFQENAELRQRLSDTEGAKDTERAQAPAVSADFVPKELADELGEEGARALGSWLHDREKAHSSELEGLKGLVLDMYSDRVMDAMSREDAFGQELSTEARLKIRERAEKLSASSGPWDALSGEARARALFLDAGKLVLDQIPAQNQSKAPRAKKARGNGTVATTPARKSASRKLSASEVIDSALDAIVDRGARDAGALRSELGIR